METTNQPPQTESINVTTISDPYTTQDSPHGTEEVEAEASNSLKQSGNESDHVPQTTTQIEENKIKTTNIQLPSVDKEQVNKDNDEEPMDISSADDNDQTDESQMHHNVCTSQQVQAFAKLQSQPQPQPQNMDDKEHNYLTDDEDDEEINSNEAKKCKYEEHKETEEDELLRSDNEDDNIAEQKEKAITVLDNISTEQEEELLKSENEEENIDREKGIVLQEIVNVKKDSHRDLKTKQEVQINIQDLKKISEDTNVTKKKNYNEIKIDLLLKANQIKEHQGPEQPDENTNQIEECHDESKTVKIILGGGDKSSERSLTTVSSSRVRRNTNNHRILYQFDLDDDSSSQDSFQYNKSPSTLTSGSKSENVKDESLTSRPQVFETVTQNSFSETTDVKLTNNEDIEQNESDDVCNEIEAAKENELPYFQSSQISPQKSDVVNSDNETNIPSPEVTSNKDEKAHSGNEAAKSAQEGSFKSDESSSDEENDMEQNIDDVNETKENFSKLSDIWNSTVHKDPNKKGPIDGNIGSHKTFSNNKDENEKETILKSPKLNGDHDSDNELNEREQITNTNVTEFETKEEMEITKSRKTSLDSNVMSPFPEQHSPCNLPQNEKSSNSIEDENNLESRQQEIYINSPTDHKMETDSDNERLLKINENNEEYHNDDSADNLESKKPSLSLSPNLATPNEDDEASRSSLASSVSYSTTTSSSQHLVIDHPMEDIKEDKVKPLKITLKRKLSYSSDDGESMGPRQKQAHLYEESHSQESQKSLFKFNEEPKQEQPKVSSNICLEQKKREIAETLMQERNEFNKMNELENQNKVLPVENSETKTPLHLQGTAAEDPSPIKSLLLQQLEKPLATLNTITNRVDSPLTILPTVYAPIQLPAPTLHTQILTPTETLAIPQPPLLPPAAGVTKYLCFKCKTGSFDSFAALTEHQATCLASHSIFPFNQMITQTPQLPPPSKLPPINSPKNSNSLSTTKPADITDLKELFATPTQPTVASAKKRYYKCSTCKTFHENWNLFLHIREQHNRHMCLYCVRFFPTAEKLALHLEIKHDLEQNHFNSEEALRNSIPVLEGYALESRFLMCCTCQHIFMESEQFSQHDCSEYIKPCSLCGQKGRHTNQCKAHPDSKRFSKLKKKKEKQMQLSETSIIPQVSNERNQVDYTVPPITISNHNTNPTIVSNSNLNCDSGQAEKNQRPPTLNSIHSEDSNSSSNMVIDESCNISHMPPAQIQTQENFNTSVSLGIHQQMPSVQLEPNLPPDRPNVTDKTAPLAPIKLVVPKLKLRVPKEFQKSVDDALTTSDSEEEVDEEEEVEEHNKEHKANSETAQYSIPITNIAPQTCIPKESALKAKQNSLLAESTPANSQDMEIDRNSATESATEAGNSQDDTAYESGGDKNKTQNPDLILDDDDSLDEPNSNLVRIMQEIERTKLDIKRTKKTSFRNNKPFALPRQPTISQSSNRTADHNWSPTPPASPNSRWFTPRRAAISQSGEEQLQKTPQHQQCLLPPPSPVKQLGTTQERRDTIGSDMMDIDETITSQPTQTIYCNQSRPLDNENLNTSSESIEAKSFNEPIETSQITDNENSASIINNTVLQSETCNKPSASPLVDHTQIHAEHESNLSDHEHIDPKPNTPEIPQSMDISQAQSTENENKEPEALSERQDDEAEDDTEIDVCDNRGPEEHKQENAKYVEVENLPPADGIEVANEDTVIVDLKLDRALDKYEIIDFVRICLKAVYPLCLYCNHARRIAVNGKNLLLHMIGNHRFSATVDSITAEELLPATLVAKLKSFLPDLEEHYFNCNSYCTYGGGAFTHHFNERIFECFQCRFVTSTHKELYLHNRKMHLRTAILCFMCRANFFSFSEILCHICPGAPNKVSVFDVKFRCCLCELDNIPSPFRLMVHLRKKHFACDVCLEDCRDQSKLSSHVWKHKLHHLCYRCGIAYRNKLDITKHLFWKHGTESTLCKRCLQKRWRHVYHFCIPPTTFICEVCNLCFSKAMHLRVHKRLHSGDLRYPCIEDNCEEKFISRKLLLKHALVHQQLSPVSEKQKDPEDSLENKENEFDLSKDTSGGDNLKTPSDLQGIKQEVMEIKKEPLDESEVDNQAMLKEKKSELAEKKETQEEKIKCSGVKHCKNDEINEKKQLDLNKPRKKRKKSKRSKELLEDLNLTAPNLSESDSSDDSDSDSDSKTKSEINALPRVMLSPPSEAENEDKDNKPSEPVEPEQVLEIWKNFLKTQQPSTVEELERLKASNEEHKQSKRVPVHVACSDHDYCKIEPDPQPAPPSPPPAPEPQVEAPKEDFKKPAAEVSSTPETSPTKRKQSKSPRRQSAKRSDASSSSSGSSSSSDSSCSCGSNCSCSSSDSDSSSSTSSSEDSDSSMASNNSMRKRHRKKSERDRIRKRSESMSPLKHHKLSVSITEVINLDDEDNTKETEKVEERLPSPPKEPLFYESDLETNESDTDEEFYDEHPQKLANELLAQKRAQLMAQTRLSPSHNYDIVENSRPSTPSLPEEVATNEKPKIKVKKKKRDRKSSCKGQALHTSHAAAHEQTIAPAQTGLEDQQPSNKMMQVAPARTLSPTAALDNPVIDSQHVQQTNLYTMPQNIMPHTIYAPPPPVAFTEQTTLTPRPITMPPYGNSHRMSEGSSCSDADGSLKRSKRQRRPNKFYGYTSDDENLINGPPLMIGSRAFKPQPPPQLTWRKEDLPTPSKSILNNKNKTPRTPKTPATPGNLFASTISTPSSKKKSRLSLSGEERSSRKRPSKKKDSKAENKFPPIPTLKIRPSQIGLNTTINHSSIKSGNYNTTDDTSSDEDTLKEHFSDSTNLNASVNNQPVATAVPPPVVLPSHPPAPPTPQTTAFNHRIPPALLPNPDFATLQYFKANNIRYPIRPPAGARQPREGESVYCYCRCPYDEVSEMIACDGENCLIEWFHFECVGIMVAPQGKWFCAECRPKYSEELYPSSATGQLNNG